MCRVPTHSFAKLLIFDVNSWEIVAFIMNASQFIHCHQKFRMEFSANLISTNEFHF